MYRSRSRDGSSTPPHWKRESERLIPMDKLKDIQEKRKRQTERDEAREAAREEESLRQNTFGYRDQPMFEQRPDYREEHPSRNQPEFDHRPSGRNERQDYGSSRKNEEKSRRRERSTDRNVHLHYDREQKRHQEPERRHKESREEYRHKESRGEHGRRYDDRNEQYPSRRRERSNEKESIRHDNEQMQKYEQRRQRRPSDIERKHLLILIDSDNLFSGEKYRKGDLANIEPGTNSYQQQSSYQAPPTGAYPVDYPNNSYYSSSTLQQPQHFLAQQQAVGYQNGSHSYDHAALKAAAEAYAKSATAAHYSTTSVPHGHYSTVSSKTDKQESGKKADLPDSYVIETETAIRPLEDSWAKDHGKGTKRVHQVIENERG